MAIKRRILSKRSFFETPPDYAFLGGVAVLAVAFALWQWWVPLQNIYEDASFALAPGAEKAYEIGNRHFNGQDTQHYDIARAEHYFQAAARLDPNLLYIHHQLARIAFLRGDFGSAMAQIDTQIALHGTSTPNSYYVRGLIEGYMGNYNAAATDYEQFLKVDPYNWAGVNDYAWVLLKAGRAQDAKSATDKALAYWPNNPWLLNSNAIARYELGDLQGAKKSADAAWQLVQKVSQPEWLHSYPGNDPEVAAAGIATFRASGIQNIHMIERALASSTVQ